MVGIVPDFDFDFDLDLDLDFDFAFFFPNPGSGRGFQGRKSGFGWPNRRPDVKVLEP